MADRKSYQNIRVENADGVTTVTLNRPDKRNAMSPELDEEMLADGVNAFDGASGERRLIVDACKLGQHGFEFRDVLSG